ncbi:hypothetical protein D3C77_409770 [compost metagenome]
MRSVAFLPQKLARTQKRQCPLLPPYDVGPLVDQNRQVPIGLNPPLIHMADHRFRGRTYGQPLFQLLACRFGYPRQLGVESLHMLFFLLEKALGNKEREVSVAMPCLLKPAVQFLLDMLPYFVTVRFEYDTAAHWRIIHQICFFNYIDIPAGKILSLRSNLRYELLLLICH